MKKYSFFLLIAFIFLSGLMYAQFKPGDVGFNSFECDIYKSAKVKTQTQIQIDSAYGYSETILVVSYYSPEGRLVKIIYNNSDLSVYDKTDGSALDSIKDEFVYYPDGRIRLIELYGYDLYPIEFGFEYDKKNKLDSSFIAGAEARRYGYEYDKSGNIIKRNGKTNMFQYDDEGNLMEGMIWVDNEESTYTWNDKQQLLSELFYLQGEFYYKIIYEYNANGTLHNYKVFYDAEQTAIPAYANYYFYNDKKLLIKMVTEEEGARMEYKYDYIFN